LFGRTYVRHSTLFLRSTFVGWSEFIRQDFRPPLVFFPLLDFLSAWARFLLVFFPFARLFVGWGEFFRLDFRPPLVFFPFFSTFCRQDRGLLGVLLGFGSDRSGGVLCSPADLV